MLTSEIIRQVHDAVHAKPRTILEIAQMLGINWRTADSYIQRIAREQGTIAVRTFRGGTRGALKIVYWNAAERLHANVVQEELFRKISSGRGKGDFSPFDIFQHLAEEKRSAFMEQDEGGEQLLKHDFASLLRSAREQLLFFSGNLSWTALRQGDTAMLGLLEELAKQGISIKILSRIELPGISNIMSVEAINHHLGRDAIEIRHVQQPLRGLLIDSSLARLKEVKEPADFKAGELDKKFFIFYNLYETEWVEWLKKVFWSFFRTAVPYRKRIADLQSVVKLL